MAFLWRAREGLRPQDPSGQYVLDLALPGQRTAFRLLLSQLSDLSNGGRSQYIKSAMADELLVAVAGLLKGL